jgi:hypothetical protein
MSYHQGSVWPLFTGWAALAEYRGGQPLAGYQMLMENANLTRAQDLGAVTELLSGDFFVPFGRSTSHQLWSSAMVITPTLRGLFGIEIDAQSKTITVNPHLPVGWVHAKVMHLAVGGEYVDLDFSQIEGGSVVNVRILSGAKARLLSTVAGARLFSASEISIPRRSVEFAFPQNEHLPGSDTESPRVLNEAYREGRAQFTLEGLAGSEVVIPYELHPPTIGLKAEGAVLLKPNDSYLAPADQWPAKMKVRFPPGEGWKTITVTLTW